MCTIFLKVDIVKAFDSVSWAFLLELLQFMGFSKRWINWVIAILSSASTCVFMNGRLGTRIYHASGLCQGDPLSPLLFVLVMDVVNAFFRLVEDRNLFTPLQAPSIKYRVSLYADDMVAFIIPSVGDINLIRGILQSFAEASGLHTNLAKCQATPIRCTEADIELL
jgi:hypothetical protein